MKVQGILVATVCLLLCFTGCAVPGQTETTSSGESHSAESTASLDDADFQQESAGFAPKDQMTEPFTVSTPIQEVIDDPIFGRYGRVLFPVDDWYMSGDTLGELQLTWYNNIDPNETVEIANTLWQRANAGETVFYDIYTEEEKAEQQKLRREYIDAYKRSLISQLENTYILEPDGTKRKVTQKHANSDN